MTIRTVLMVLLLALLAGCQTSSSTPPPAAKPGESGWISQAQRPYYIRELVRNELVPVKIACRYTDEEFPEMEFKVWNKKVEGLSRRSLQIFTEFGTSHTYRADEVAQFKTVPSIDVAYYKRMQVWRGCMIPTPYLNELEWQKNLARLRRRT